jgi:hypothetical protein
MAATRRWGQPALGVEFHHGTVAARLDLLGPAQPHPLLGVRATPSRELTRVEGHEHPVKRRRDRMAATPAGGSNGALADPSGLLACGHAQPVAGEGFAQRRPGDPELLSGGIHATEPLGQGEGAFGLGAVGEEGAGLPAQRLPRMLRNRRQQLDEADVAALAAHALSVLRRPADAPGSRRTADTRGASLVPTPPWEEPGW